MTLRDALLLMAERTPFQSDAEKADVVGAIKAHYTPVPGDGEQSPAETESDTPAPAGRRRGTGTRVRK